MALSPPAVTTAQQTEANKEICEEKERDQEEQNTRKGEEIEITSVTDEEDALCEIHWGNSNMF